MRALLNIVSLSIVLTIVYLFAWPVPVQPVAWNAPVDVGFVGDFTVNNKLDSFDKLTMGELTGPEAAGSDSNGNLHATSHEGWIVRWAPGQQQAEKWINVGGRPLGIDFDSQGNLWIANAYIGLMKLTPSGQLSTVLTETDGVPIQYADDLAVAPNGKIYLSDASTRFSAKASNSTLAASLLDILEHSDNGRIIEFDPQSNISRVVKSNLTFANGVAADPAGEYIYFAETGEYRVWRMALSGSKAFQSEVIIDNLPGFVDNVHTGQNGRIWLGLTSPRSQLIDDLAGEPFWRKVIQRFPPFMRPKILPYGVVIAIDQDGKVLANLQSPSGAVFATTGAAESDDYLYVTSLTAPFLARYSKTQLQLK
jgi:sugar lactone lactonase YvrE